MITALVLAAGRSKRMWPIENKNLLKFCGKSLLENIVEKLIQSGIKKIVVVTGKHNLEQMNVEVEKFKNLFTGVNFVLVVQENLDEGMAGAVKSSAQEILNGPVMVVSSNDIVEKSAYEMVVNKFKENGKGVVLAKRVKEYFPGGYLKINRNGEMIEIIEKPGAGNEPSDLVNIVVHLHVDGKKLVKFMNQAVSEKDDLYEVGWQALLNEGEKYIVADYFGKWQAVKFPWHILKAMEIILNEEIEKRSQNLIDKTVEIDKKAVIRGKVIIEKGVKVMANAVIQGPCYIGKDVVIANNALVRASQVGEKSVVGFSTEIARSYLGESVWTHSNYVGDSVILNNSSFGAGTITGNMRLDEAEIEMIVNGLGKVKTGIMKLGVICGNGVRVGINTNFMPGVKIGNNCFIGAGVNVAVDIEENKFVYLKSEVLIKENLSKVNQSGRNEILSNLKKHEN